MTERAYYSESYTREFNARVREHTTLDGRPAVVLDRTYFYPNAGGQPDDRGVLGGVAVEGVAIRESDQALLHLLAGPLPVAPGGGIAAVIDWPRRWDHMQQHTGQHILSQAFLRAAEAATIGFHLGAETVTIDLDQEALSPAVVDRAERIANEAVAANHAVRAWFPDPNELAGIALRKTPDVDGPLRVVAIGDFDINACGGTHVRQSAEVGQIKILKTEKQKKGARVEFVCGGRALADYGRKHALAVRLAAEFTCGATEVAGAVDRLRDEAQALRRDLRAAREELLDYEAARLLAAQAPADAGQFRLVRGLWPARDMADLRGLAARLVAGPGVVALLGAPGEKASLVFGRSADVERDMNALFKAAIRQLPGARGGGSASLAQGGGAPAAPDELGRVLDSAEDALK